MTEEVKEPMEAGAEQRPEEAAGQYYVGVKIVKAWREAKDGSEGYGVRYESGYVSWSPRKTFEAFYLPMGKDPSKVSKDKVDRFLGQVIVSRLDEKTALVVAETITGFRQYETTSCVDPKNFDIGVGKQIGIERITNTLWKCLGFVVQWGRFGLKNI